MKGFAGIKQLSMEKEMEIPSMEGRRGKMAREGRRGGNRIGRNGGRTTGNIKKLKSHLLYMPV